jgi:hypothetical protein
MSEEHKKEILENALASMKNIFQSSLEEQIRMNNILNLPDKEERIIAAKLRRSYCPNMDTCIHQTKWDCRVKPCNLCTQNEVIKNISLLKLNVYLINNEILPEGSEKHFIECFMQQLGITETEFETRTNFFKSKEREN